MNFFNKATLLVFPLANSLLVFQMFAVLVVLFPLRYMKVVNFPPLNIERARNLLPVTLLYAANVLMALMSMRTLNIPMYSTLKRLTPMMIILGKWRMYKKLPEGSILASVAVIVCGCIIAGLGDFSFNLVGYTYALSSCTLQASYLLLVEHRGARKGVTTSEMLLYNAVMSLPFLLLLNLCTGELFQIRNILRTAADSIGTARLVMLLISSSIAGMLLNFSLFLCTNVNSALTTTIAGTLKGAVATALGFFLLGGVEFHLLNVVGIVLNTLGGVWYSVIKYKTQSRLASSLPKHSKSSVDLTQESELPVTVNWSESRDIMFDHSHSMKWQHQRHSYSNKSNGMHDSFHSANEASWMEPSTPDNNWLAESLPYKKPSSLYRGSSREIPAAQLNFVVDGFRGV